MKSRKKTDLELAIIGAVEEGRLRLGPPPDDRLLLAYHRGELSDEESARVQELLAHYPDSVRRLADLTGLQSEPGDPDYLSDEELERDWKRLQLKLEESKAGQPQAAGVVSLHRPETAGEPESDALAQAAVLARQAARWRAAAGLAALALLASLFYPRTEPAGPPPQPEVLARRVLLPDGARRGGESQAIRVPSPGAAGVLLVPSLSGKPGYSGYKLEIVRAEAPGKVLWSQTGIRLNEDDSFDLLIPPGSLAPGRHILRLHGLRNTDPPEHLADYTVDF